MKQVLLFGFALVLTAVGIGFYMRPTPSLPGESGVSTGTSTDTVFTLYRTSGEVFYRQEQDNNFTSLTVDSVELPNNTTVKTANGKAAAILSDKSVITIKENTEILISSSSAGFNIKQFFGKTYHRVETVITGKTYEVRTPSTLAAVRGTKFAVFYDEKTKESKVSVTENRVSVKETEDIHSTSTPDGDESSVEEGETATVKSDHSGGKGTTITSTDKEKEMKEFIDSEAELDEIYEEIKRSNNDKDEFKNKIREVLKKDENERKDDKKDEPEKKEVIETKKEEIKEETREDSVKKEEEVRVVATTTVKKLSEEAFFDKFEPLFIRLFYIDEQMNPCAFRGTPVERVKQVTALANESGYPIPSTTKLTIFAEDITKFCATKDGTLRESLQKRFDDEYPYQQ